METKEEKQKHYYSHMRFIQISNSFLYDVSRGAYSNQDLLVYATVKMLASGTASPNSDETAVVTSEILLSMMNMCVNTRNKKSVTESIKTLYDGGLIGIYKDFSFSENVEEFVGQGVFYIKVEEKIPRGEHFVKVYTEEYTRIMNSGEKYTSKLFHTYMTIVGDVFECGDMFTYITNTDIIETTGIDKKTVTAHIKALESSKAIYRKMLSIKDKDGNHRNKNVMTRFGWRDSINMVHL